MNTYRIVMMAAVAGLLATGCIFADDAHRLGIGANYWKKIKDVDLTEVDKNGFSWLVTYQYAPGCPLSLETDLEYFNKGLADTSKDVFAPQAFIVLGTSFYGAVGIGKYFSDGKFTQDPFYGLRLGFDFPVTHSLYMDFNLNYRFNEWTSISKMAKNINSDTITLGAAVRYQF